MTSIITNTLAFYLSSSLPDELRWNTDAQSLNVHLYHQHVGNTLVNVSLAPHGGVATLHELKNLVERYMRLNGIAKLYPLIVRRSDDGGLTWKQDAALTVFFCEKNIDAPGSNGAQNVSGWLEKHFLSTRSAKVLPNDTAQVERLFFAQPQNTPPAPVLHVTHINEDGDAASADITLQADYPVSASNLYVAEFSIDAIRAAEPSIGEVVAVTVSVGDRHMEYYRPARRPDIAFLFRNAFNVEESAYINAVVTRKTADNRKTARVGGRLEIYDRIPDTEFEVNTAALDTEQAEWIDQLITSPDVKLIDGTPVVITDGQAECHNDNSAMNTAKFSFSQRDRRHIVHYNADTVNIFSVPPHSYQFA